MNRELKALGECCAHTKPVTKPCEGCAAAILDRVRQQVESTVKPRIEERTAHFASELEQAKASEAKMAARLTDLMDQVARLRAANDNLTGAIADRAQRMQDLDAQLAAERGVRAAARMLDLSE